MSGERLVRNPLAGPLKPDAGAPPSLAFHRALPGYRPTPLVEPPRAAEALGVERVLVKDESGRLGLPSFKVLGSSWAMYRALCERVGAEPGIAVCSASRRRSSCPRT